MKSDFCRDQLQPSSDGDVFLFFWKLNSTTAPKAEPGTHGQATFSWDIPSYGWTNKSKKPKVENALVKHFCFAGNSGTETCHYVKTNKGNSWFSFQLGEKVIDWDSSTKKQNVFALLRDASGMGSAEAMSLQRQQRHEDNGQKESFFFSPSLFAHLPFPTLQTNAANHITAHVNHSFCIHARAYVRAAGLDGRFLNMRGMHITVCGFLKCYGKILKKRQRKASGHEHSKEKVSFTPFEPVHFKAKFHRCPKKDMKNENFWPNILQLKRKWGRHEHRLNQWAVHPVKKHAK